MIQKHLTYDEMVKLGSYYTKTSLVDIVYKLVQKEVKDIENYKLLDSSCGYGSFINTNLQFKEKIGADIDEKSISVCKETIKDCKLVCCNSLFNVSRSTFGLTNDDKLIIVGNPPYNDTTSQTHQKIKQNTENIIDEDLKARDLGISFLLSYNKLKSDYVCILHPLSYLIKKTNFNFLSKFSKNYKLIDDVVISSNEFDFTSKLSAFPIIIGLYKRTGMYENNEMGMDYQYITDYNFKVENKNLKLSNFDYISNYITKYPNQKKVRPDEAVGIFYTMRDINALKRSQTFMDKVIHNSILITKDKLKYYCYVDVFKDYIKHIPYYMGNMDIIINNDEFLKIYKHFECLSAIKHPSLSKYIEDKIDVDLCKKIVDNYFKQLLGEHYVY